MRNRGGLSSENSGSSQKILPLSTALFYFLKNNTDQFQFFFKTQEKTQKRPPLGQKPPKEAYSTAHDKTTAKPHAHKKIIRPWDPEFPPGVKLQIPEIMSRKGSTATVPSSTLRFFSSDTTSLTSKPVEMFPPPSSLFTDALLEPFERHKGEPQKNSLFRVSFLISVGGLGLRKIWLSVCSQGFRTTRI